MLNIADGLSVLELPHPHHHGSTFAEFRGSQPSAYARSYARTCSLDHHICHRYLVLQGFR